MQRIDNDDPAKTGFVVICRDRTQRHSAEGASRRSEQQFRHLIAGFQDLATCTLDQAGQINSWSEALERLLGYGSRDIIGRAYADLFSAEDRRSGLPGQAIDRALREGRLRQAGWRMARGGGWVYASEVIDVIRNDVGEHLGFSLALRDVSAQAATEQALEAAKRALFQSQKLEMIGQLNGGVAHDFNNLLSAILGNLELGRRRLPADSDVTRFLDNAIIGAKRGAALVGRMMNFAREQEIEIRPIDLKALFDELSDLVAKALGPETVLESRFPEKLAPVRIDPHQLELALLNLVVNARDAMAEGGTIRLVARNRRISAGTERCVAPGRYVQLDVTDHGCGMDAETLSRACDVFFTTKPAGKGTGLGLSMVQGFVGTVGGRMSIKSCPGKGTTVTLLLPAAPSPADGVFADDELETADVKDHPERKLRILVVDDDALVLMNSAALLNDLGHETFALSSAEEALSFLQNATTHRPVDLVLTDHAMPHMTGLELARLLRKSWPSLPVVLATGYAEDVVDGTGIVSARLQKPFGIRDLRAVIAAAVDGAEARTGSGGIATRTPHAAPATLG
nr:ATP-binding protein [Jiella avicenniae]